QEMLDTAAIRLERPSLLGVLIRTIEILLPQRQHSEVRPSRRLARRCLRRQRELLPRHLIHTGLQSCQSDIERADCLDIFRRPELRETRITRTRRAKNEKESDGGLQRHAMEIRMSHCFDGRPAFAARPRPSDWE